MRASSVDAVVCDLPFGNLCGTANINKKLYPQVKLKLKLAASASSARL